MAIRERQVKNKRNSQGVLTGKPGKVFDVNVKTYENGKQKSIAKRGFATRKEQMQDEAHPKSRITTRFCGTHRKIASCEKRASDFQGSTLQARRTRNE